MQKIIQNDPYDFVAVYLILLQKARMWNPFFRARTFRCLFQAFLRRTAPGYSISVTLLANSGDAPCILRVFLKTIDPPGTSGV
jgi:hypothetical protein